MTRSSQNQALGLSGSVQLQTASLTEAVRLWVELLDEGRWTYSPETGWEAPDRMAVFGRAGDAGRLVT